jgi:glutamate dehydrogenase/leucine dehydrogenase
MFDLDAGFVGGEAPNATNAGRRKYVTTTRTSAGGAAAGAAGGPRLFERMEAIGAEQVMFGSDVVGGSRSLVVVHSTVLGPALGGVRMWPYPSEGEALADALRLSQAMTLKAAAAGLDLGGGAGIIIGDPARDKSEQLLRTHGRFIATLGGRFIPVNDVGTTQADIETIGREASPVCDSGDPSPYTALGVREAIRAALGLGRGLLSGTTIAIQGVGNVGSELLRLLREEGADVVVADLVDARAREAADRYGARVVSPEEIVTTPCDVLAPCALGGVVTAATAPQLRCRVIAGGANNVLQEPELAAELDRQGICYVPDFVANAGGLIYLEEGLLGHDDARAAARVLRVGETVTEILDRARELRATTDAVATELAEVRLARRRQHPPVVGGSAGR